MSRLERKWPEFESSVCAAVVMRGTDVGAKMAAVAHLQSLAEDLQREDESDESDVHLPDGTSLRDFRPT